MKENSMNPISRLLRRKPVLLLDGAMGTLLMEAGLPPGVPPETWNESHPEEARTIHEAYLTAGADIILTNSFGGSSFRLRGHGLQGGVFRLNRAAAQAAREAADAAPRLRGASHDADSPVLVGGSVGPSGELMAPLGTLSSGEAREVFAGQVAGLAKGGVDLIWIETMSDLREVEAAILGTRDACDLPVAVTMTFDAGGRTIMGVSPEEALDTLAAFDLAAVGANCGNGPEETEKVVEAMASLGTSLPLIIKSNAGRPTWMNGALVYNGTPAVMGEHARRARELGASLIGGCCGTTPAHVREMARVLRGD